MEIGSPTSRDSSSRSVSGLLARWLLCQRCGEYDALVLVVGIGAALTAAMNAKRRGKIIASRVNIVATYAVVG